MVDVNSVSLEQEKSVCRLCGNTADSLIDIFSEDGQSKKLDCKINYCLPIMVSRGDPLPKQVCKMCINKLDIVVKFLKTSIKAERKLTRNEDSETNIFDKFTDLFNSDEGSIENFTCPVCCDGELKLIHIKDERNVGGILINGEFNENASEDGADISDAVLSEVLDLKVLNSTEDVTKLTEESVVEKVIVRCRQPSCCICGELFESAVQCAQHRHWEPGNVFPCSLCNKQLSDDGAWQDHVTEHAIIEQQEQQQQNIRYLCQLCNITFDTYGSFGKHSCPEMGTHLCETCGSTFLSDVHHTFHYNLCHGSTPLTCVFCSKTCRNTLEYWNHMKIEHEHSCVRCGQMFHNNQNDFMEHILKCEGNTKVPLHMKSFQCDVCGLHMANKNMYQEHLFTQHLGKFPSEPVYQCLICKQVAPSLADIIAHMSTHPSSESSALHQLEEISVSQLFMCQFCDRCYTDKASLKSHQIIHAGLFECLVCGDHFCTYSRATTHKSGHGKPIQGDQFSVPKLLVCLYCDECFPHWISLCCHQRNVHPELAGRRGGAKLENREQLRKLPCQECGQEFTTRSGLALHQRAHTLQQFMCELCGEKFRLKGAFERHMRKHAGVKPFVCQECGKGFTQNSGLYTHRRVHTGEKPYPCDFCGRRFRLKHDRDNHRRCHTGERPYKCEFCGKAFRTSHDHRQHLLIHSGERPYKCCYCGKGFRRINGLNVHKRIHTGEKPFSCEMCGRRFTQKGDMMKHRRTQHGMEI